MIAPEMIISPIYSELFTKAHYFLFSCLNTQTSIEITLVPRDEMRGCLMNMFPLNFGDLFPRGGLFEDLRHTNAIKC